MATEEFFLVVFEIAVAIMGFSGITVAIASRSANTTKAIRVGFNAMLVAPIFLAAFSALAFVLYRSDINKDDLVTILSGLMVFYLFTIIAVRILQIGWSAWMVQIRIPGFAVAIFFMSSNFCLQAANLVHFHSLLLLIAGVFILVVTVLLVFSAFLWTLWNQA